LIINGLPHHRRLARVDGNCGAASRQLPHDRYDPVDLVAFPNRSGAWPRGLAAHVDKRRALRRHSGARGSSILGSFELPAVGKAVGRGVDDPHDLRLIEADGALAHPERRTGRSQI
jgi:hypothetical protein